MMQRKKNLQEGGVRISAERQVTEAKKGLSREEIPNNLHLKADWAIY